MEVEPTGKDVGAGQALEAELGAVRAAAYGLHLGRHATVAHGLQGNLYDMHHRLDLLAHVVVLVLDLDLGTAGKLGIDLIDQVLDLLLALFEAGAVVIANDVAEGRLLHGAVDADQVVEAFVTLGVFGSLGARQHGDELVGDAYRVEHLVLGVSGMHVATLEGDAGAGSIEVLVLELADGAAVHSIGEVTAEALDVELMGAKAYLLVGVEADSDLAVLDLGVGLQPGHSADDFGDAGLVVGTQQGGAVGDNQVLAHVVEQLGEILRRQLDAELGVEHYLAAGIGFYDARADVLAAHVGTRVHVRDEAHYGYLLVVAVGGKGGEQVAILIEAYLLQAHVPEHLLEMPGEHHLARSRRSHVRLFVALRVVFYEIKKSINYSHGIKFRTAEARSAPRFRPTALQRRKITENFCNFAV